MKFSFTQALDFTSKHFKLISFVFVIIMAAWSYFFSFKITLPGPVIFILAWIPFVLFRWFRWLYTIKVRRKYKGGEEVCLKGTFERMFVFEYENFSTSKVICHKLNGDTITFHENSLEIYIKDDKPNPFSSNAHSRNNRW
jgi:hypothetical protein